MLCRKFADSGGLSAPFVADLHLPSSSLPHMMELPAYCRELQTDEDDADLLGVRKDRCSLMISSPHKHHL